MKKTAIAKFLLSIGFAVLTVLMSGCATIYRIPVFDNVPQSISETEVRVGVNKDHMRLSFAALNTSVAGAQFGLLGAVIGSVIDSTVNRSNLQKADEIAKKSYKNSSFNYDIEKEFSDVLDLTLGSDLRNPLKRKDIDLNQRLNWP
ncbi:MAG: hypothetical protein ACC707_01710 [Thiohalomonadales bacterium]